jgi:hypothetical protein
VCDVDVRRSGVEHVVGGKLRRYRFSDRTPPAKLTTLQRKGLAALCVMDAPSHAKSAKGAKKDRVTVASHLVCDVDVRRSGVEHVVGGKLRRYRFSDRTPPAKLTTLHPVFLRGLCVTHAPTFTAEDAEANHRRFLR